AQDFNNDGTTGPITSTIESAGSTTLAKVADSYFLYAHGTTTGPQLKMSGIYVAVGQFGAWTPLGAEQSGGGYQVVWKNGGANQYVVWTTDGSGNFLSQGAVVTSASYSLHDVHPIFAQDFNSDGTTGPITSTIESAGSTTLAKVADS